MTAFWILLGAAVAMVVAQDVSPGAAVYHTGWYNAVDIALFVVAAMQAPKLRRAQAARAGTITAMLFGAGIIVVSGVAAGLMAPDTHEVVGAPGASVHDEDTGGTFVFPLTQNAADPGALAVQFTHGRSSAGIGAGRRYTGGFIMWQHPRTVVYVEASDARGNHVTITQPTNASFLSPVLLMQQSTTIAGMDVRFDTFAVPQLSKSVKAVLFSPQQAAQLHTPALNGTAAVLFDVVPGGIGVVPSGARKTIGGLQLDPEVATYPSVIVASGPELPILLLGALIFAAGLARFAFIPSSRL